tara:strand:+ start:520 stop:801 length:282 start_codon:yes stop_codon:yes gene_type:complete
MPFEIENKEMPLGIESRYMRLERLMKTMTITQPGERGDSLTFKAKRRKKPNGETRAIYAAEDSSIRKIAKANGLKFKCVGDQENMTVTYWRVK